MMTMTQLCSTRRGFLGGLALGALAFTRRGLFAEELFAHRRKQKARSIRTNFRWIRTTIC